MGANWAYDELRDGVKVSSYKQWSIASFAEMGDARHDKQATKAFLQVRPSALDFSHKWISSREKGERMLFWEKEDQFTPDLEPRNTTFFVPRKIRLNEGLAAPLESPEKERYQQIEYLPGRPEPVVIECLDSWNVIPVEEVRSMPSSNFPERFAKAICHRRVGTVMSVHPPRATRDVRRYGEDLLLRAWGGEGVRAIARFDSRGGGARAFQQPGEMSLAPV